MPKLTQRLGEDLEEDALVIFVHQDAHLLTSGQLLRGQRITHLEEISNIAQRAKEYHSDCSRDYGQDVGMVQTSDCSGTGD